MGQLTGLLLGTAFDDVFAADVAVEVVDPADFEATGTAIARAQIETFDGSDIVTARATVTNLSGYPTVAGVLNSAIALGAGGDRLEVSATVNGIFSTADGVRFSSLHGGEGDDTFIITAKSFFIENSSILAGGTSRGLSHATLDSGNGNNTITISSTVETAPRFAISYGLLDGSVRVGTGDDTISITGFAQSAGAFYPVGSGGGRGAESYGVKRGAIATDSGNDLVIINAISETAGFANATTHSLLSSSVRVGDGDDTVRILANSYSTDYFSGGSDSYAVRGSIIDGGSGNDEISVSAYASGYVVSLLRPAESSALGDSTITGGAGNDVIVVTAENQAGSQRFGATFGAAYGVSRSGVQGDQGDDRILIYSLATASAYAGGQSYSTGVGSSSIAGGAGDDVLKIFSEARSSSYIATLARGTTAISTGLSNSTFSGGDGHDTLQITVKAQAASDISSFTYEAIAIGVHQAAVLGDRGNDTIDISATITGRYEFAGKGFAYGMKEGRVEGGEGNDLIRIVGDASAQIGEYDVVEGYGVVNGSVSGGDGDDLIAISGTTLAIQDALISGGSGDDTFHIGLGQGALDGGTGDDLVILDFLDLQTMAIAALGNNGLRIVGTQDGQGKDATWTQTIWNVERFQLGSEIFHTAGDLLRSLPTPPR
jgi:hypothetical protein